MQNYDVTLRMLLKGGSIAVFGAMTGLSVERWLDVELPKVQNPRLDLLGETAGGGLVQWELQRANDAQMPLRMAEYALGVYRRFGQFPRQLVLCVGEPALRMQPDLQGANFSFRYELLDTRDLDGERLLASEQAGDQVLAILTRAGGAATGQVVRKISGLEESERDIELRQLMILAGLRGLEDAVEEEIRKVPILNDIMDHKVLGREYKRGRQKGLEEGIQEGKLEGIREGIREGIQEGELKILRRLIQKRFGALPAWAEEKTPRKGGSGTGRCRRSLVGRA